MRRASGRNSDPDDPEWSYGRYATNFLRFLLCAVIDCTPLFFGLWITFNFYLNIYVGQVVPEPYLDEVFHIPQAQLYCNGTFDKWDSKITTLPGTYLVTLPLTALPAILTGNPVNTLCTTFGLRMVSFGAWIMCLFTFRRMVDYALENASLLKRNFAAVTLSMFPVLYFFQFLYYTDVFSTLFVLQLMLQFHKGKFIRSAIAGALAVLTRQTNIIWVAGIGIHIVKAVVMHEYTDAVVNIRQKLANKYGYHRAQYSRGEVDGTLTFQGLILLSWKDHMEVLRKVILSVLKVGSGYITVGLCFLVFVIRNGGIVVGDKAAHQVTVNFPQVIYFSLFFGFFSVCTCLRHVPYALYNVANHWVRFLILVVLTTLAIRNNTVIHPYLLADNRHYPFYIWKLYWNTTPFLKYAVIVPAVSSWFAFVPHLHPSKSIRFIWVMVIIINLVPQGLLEFRYFLPAFFFVRFRMMKSIGISWNELIGDCITFFVVNLATINTFLYRPFFWPGVSEVQRFMW